MATIFDQQPGYDYSLLLPLRTPTSLDPDELSSDLTPEFSPAGGLLGDMMRGLMAPTRVYRGEISPEAGANQALGVMPTAGLLARAPAGSLAMNVWHGGPNRWAAEPGFPQGRPRLDKMGTGEGAQKYGKGFYTAEQAQASQTYKNPEGSYARLSGHLDPKTEFAFDMLEQGSGATDVMSAMLSKYGGNISYDDAIRAIDNARTAGAGTGNLYKLDIPDADVAKLLDYDAPISAQPKVVQDAITKLGFMPDNPDKMAGGDIWFRMRQQLGEQEAADAMRAAGVPGLRYKDAGSRGKTDSAGTRNFVVWDQDVLDRTKVLQRNDETFGLLDDVSMYDLPAGSDPRYLGAAPDRSGFTYLRYTPKKNTPRVQASLAAMKDPANETRLQMMRDIERGIELGGADWYNTEELRDWFIKELGPERGHQEWSNYMDLMGAASPGSKVPANIGNASEIRRRLASGEMRGNMTEGESYRQSLLDVDKLDAAREVARGRTKGYGHKTQGLQELIAARQQQGKWGGSPEPGTPPAKGNWAENPKPKGFSQSLKGSERNIAADLHFTRYMAMASQDPRWLTTQAEIGKDVASELRKIGGKKVEKYFGSREVNGKLMTTFNAKDAVKKGDLKLEDVVKLKSPQMWAEKPNDSEYAAMEALMYDVGQELGMTGPQVQAALWMGAADRTGVDPTSQGTFMELFRRRADERAAKENMTREQVIRRFIRDNGLLSAPGLPGASQLQPATNDAFGRYSGGIL